jgi:hypothetical protein
LNSYGSESLLNDYGNVPTASTNPYNSGVFYAPNGVNGMVTPRTLIAGQEYYIRVRAFESYDTGDYKIGFTTSVLPPDAITYELSTSSWNAYSFNAFYAEHWGRFTATAATQYIKTYFTSGSQYVSSSLGIYVRLYHPDYGRVGGEVFMMHRNLALDPNKIIGMSWTLVPGQEYYLRVRVTGTKGSYRITVNSTPP